MSPKHPLFLWSSVLTDPGNYSGGIEFERIVSKQTLSPCILSSVLLTIGPSCSFPPDPSSSRNGQAARAAALARSALEFCRSIREDRLPLEEMRGVPQCMYQYWWLFGVARVPNEDGGRLRMDADARHIMVMCRGQIYRLNVLEEDTFQIVDEDVLASALQYILEDASQLSAADASTSSVGAFTTEQQKQWARCRTSIAQGSVRNGRNLGAIDSSLFALCLDDSTPETDGDVCRNMICGTTTTEKTDQIGTCANRWYDKLAIIVCQNGAAGMNFEHTCTDGSVDIRMACDIYAGSLAPPETGRDDHHNGSQEQVATRSNGIASDRNPPSGVRKLDWDLSVEIKDALSLAQTHLVDRIHQHQLAVLNFREYGKPFITSSGFSPDAFFQMAIHAAYSSFSGQLGNGFEPVLMRQFLHGRTDVVRTATAECAAFVRIFNDPKASAEAKIDALRTATTAHVAKFRDCAKGSSHHRHLFVLNQMWKRREAFLKASGMKAMEEAGQGSGEFDATTIFTDPGWSRLGTTVVMGSNVDNPHISYAGFGPPSAEGYTVCYYIRKDHIALSVNSRNGKAQTYADAIEKTLNGIKALLAEIPTK